MRMKKIKKNVSNRCGYCELRSKLKSKVATAVAAAAIFRIYDEENKIITQQKQQTSNNSGSNVKFHFKFGTVRFECDECFFVFFSLRSFFLSFFLSPFNLSAYVSFLFYLSFYVVFRMYTHSRSFIMLPVVIWTSSTNQRSDVFAVAIQFLCTSWNVHSILNHHTEYTVHIHTFWSLLCFPFYYFCFRSSKQRILFQFDDPILVFVHWKLWFFL